MKRTALAALIFTVLAGSASAASAPVGARLSFAATHVIPGRSLAQFVGPTSAEWSSWAARSQTPAPAITITIMSNAMCGDPAVPGCREDHTPGLPAWGMYASNRDSFYFELGGMFDAAVLTNADRSYLARKWGVPHWHWQDSEKAIEMGAAAGVGVEDGLEGIFATIYQDCAWGHSTTDTSYSTPIPDGLHVTVPSIGTGSFDTCAFIQRVAGRR